MNDKPLVSYCIVSYNAEKFIQEAIESALNQDYYPMEIIISDDCSTDNTDEIVSKYDDERIIYLKNKNLQKYFPFSFAFPLLVCYVPSICLHLRLLKI